MSTSRLQAFLLCSSSRIPFESGLDMIQCMAEESGLTVDVTSYNMCMDEAKVRSKVT